MEIVKSKWRSNVLLKAWRRCRSLGSSNGRNTKSNYLTKSKSWHSASEEDRHNKKNRQVAPEGCFFVYVGPEKQRFVVKTEFASHPLFMMLLQDAESEYGFNSQGPILLPCEVDLFYKVLAEMDSGYTDDIFTASPTCGALVLCSPSGHRHRLFSPSPMLKLNHF